MTVRRRMRRDQKRSTLRGTSGVAARTLIGTVSVALVLVGSIAGVASASASRGGSTRVYKMGFLGALIASYSASDDTAFDIQRGAFVGCTYSEQGDTKVGWQDVWKVTAVVHPKSGHVHIKKLRYVQGPGDRRVSGTSEISGKAADAPGDDRAQCSSSRRAGSWDCTAEAVTPRLFTSRRKFLPTFETSEDHAKAWDIHLPAFEGSQASYDGEHPKALPCDSVLGNNESPGGFVATEALWGYLGDATVFLTHEQLIALRRGTLESNVIGNHNAGWSFEDYPLGGDTCNDDPEEDEVCTYDHTFRNARVIIKRLK